MPVAFYDDCGKIVHVADDSPVHEGVTSTGESMYLIDKSLLDPEMVKKYRCRVVT